MCVCVCVCVCPQTHQGHSTFYVSLSKQSKVMQTYILSLFPNQYDYSDFIYSVSAIAASIKDWERR